MSNQRKAAISREKMSKRKIYPSQQEEKLNFNKKKKIPPKKRSHPELDLIQPLDDKQESNKEIGWIQYRLGPRNGIKKRQVSTNAATIHGIAKKLIAREWARILGRPMSSRYDTLEIEAASLKNRMEKKKVKR